MAKRSSLVAALLAASLTAGCAGAGHSLPAISEADSELAAARIAAAPGLEPATRTTYQNEVIARRAMRRLQGVAKPVCDAAEREACWFTLQYSPKGKLNAYVLRNQIVLYDGLAQYLNTEDEFAAVIAHEMGHHIAHHYEKGLQNRTVGAIIAGAIFAGIAGATNAYGNNSYQAQSDMRTAMNLGVALGQISFSKEHEREADYISAYLLARAGYNPKAAGEIWVKLTKASGRTKTKLLDSHPAGPDRLAAWDKAVEEVQFSSDLIPNLEGAAKEPRLQEARLFDVPSKLAPRHQPSTALASKSRALGIANPPNTGYGLTATANSLASTSYNQTGFGTWTGGGAQDSCGASWQIRAQKISTDLRGNMWWNGIKYDLYGDIDAAGRAKGVRAGRNQDSRNMAGPRFFALDLAFSGDKATGHYQVDSRSGSCRTEVLLSRN